MSEPLLTIQDAARQVGVSVGTLRVWERAGLIAPKRNSAGQRQYDNADVRLGKAIKAQRSARIGSGLRHPRVTV